MEFSTDAARRQDPTRHDLKHGTIYEARAEDVYPLLTPGSVSLVHSDGPYAVGKADWDRMKVSDLAAWYAPHIEAWGHLCAPSASIYHWGTAEGWAAVHPEYLRQGWTFRALITWDKGLGFLAGKCDVEGTRTWPTVTEVCGFYQRQPALEQILNYERCRLGLSTGAAAKLVVGTESGAWRNWEYYGLGMSADNWVRAHTALNDLGPDLVASGCYRWRMQVMQSVHRMTPDEVRAEYLLLRAPFTLPQGITNVWRENQVSGDERRKGDDGQSLHPCQKPLAFADRMIRASSRPGDTILEPFGGTCRIAVACEQIARYKPADARRYVCVEMNADGVDYIGPVLRQIQENGKQVTLFEGFGR